jgi:hypothetical protein
MGKSKRAPNKALADLMSQVPTRDEFIKAALRKNLGGGAKTAVEIENCFAAGSRVWPQHLIEMFGEKPAKAALRLFKQ